MFYPDLWLACRLWSTFTYKVQPICDPRNISCLRWTVGCIDRWTQSSPRQKISFMLFSQLIDVITIVIIPHRCCCVWSERSPSAFLICVKDFCISCLSLIAWASGWGRSVFLCHHPSSSIRGMFCSAPWTPGLPVSTLEVLWETRLSHKNRFSSVQLQHICAGSPSPSPTPIFPYCVWLMMWVTRLFLTILLQERVNYRCNVQ